MDRVTQIYRHPLYRQELLYIGKAEEERVFCGHDLRHFLDVARIGWALCLERQLSVPKELVYAAALLHDIGRGRQYREGISHDEASAVLAEEIMPSCGYTPEETEVVCQAITGHRLSCEKDSATALGAVLKEADHLSRCCFACEAEADCYWPKEKKNLEIRM